MKYTNKTIFFTILTLLIGLNSCSKPHDYSGIYLATTGDQCKLEPGDNTLITISPSSADSDSILYTARLSSQWSGNGILPLESKPSIISDDGSLTFYFFKEGKAGFSSAKPAVDMIIKLAQKDKNHLTLNSWLVKISNVNNPSLGGNFDFVKDAQIEIMGRKVPNDIFELKGKNGLCLKKEQV